MKNHGPWAAARIARISQPSPTIRLFDLEPGTTRRAWEPGAHLDVQLDIDGRRQTRSYSLVGESHATPGYRIAVKRIDVGQGGSRRMWALREGDALTISEPINEFGLRLDAPSYTLVAGGIGITPIFGMAQRLARLQRPLKLHYAVRTRAEAAFADELAASLGDKLSLHVADEATRLDLARALGASAPGSECYVCGPIGMLEAARRAWNAQGRDPAALRYESFGAGGHARNQPFTALLPRFGRRVEVAAGQTLLDALEQAGIDVLSDCRRGECGLCALDVLAADTPIDHRDVFFSESQQSANRRLCACVSRAAGGVITIDTAYRGSDGIDAVAGQVAAAEVVVAGRGA